jgi:hypothetical protein
VSIRRVCLPFSFIVMALAIAFMWFLYPTKIDYKQVLQSGSFFYEANMLGPLPGGYNIDWRSDSFTNDTNPFGDQIVGGWIIGNGLQGAGDLPASWLRLKSNSLTL